ncbi:hypothetical protein ACF0H5_001093 [Mactra antiquata]
MAKNISTSRRITFFVLLLGIVSFLCMLIATVSYAWIFINVGHSNWTLLEGIWMTKLCTGNECRVSSREIILTDIGLQDSLSPLPQMHWIEFKLFTFLSVFGSFATVVIATYIVVRKSKRTIYTPVFLCCGSASITSCIFMLIPILKISAVSAINFDPRAWSLYVATVGVLLQFITSCMIVLATYQNYRFSFKIKLSRWLSVRRNREELIMQYLTSQRQACERTYQSESVNTRTEGKSNRTFSDDVDHSSTDNYRGSVKTVSTDVSHDTCTRNQLPHYYEITGI